jgi:uncharacterized membrane protein
VCPSCGGPIGVAPAYQQPPQYQEQPPQYQQQQTYQQPAPTVAPGQADPRDVEDNKVMAILAYIIFFIPLLAGTHKTSPYVKFHTNQGTILFICSAGLSIVLSILSAVLTAALLFTPAIVAILTIFSIVWIVLPLGILALVIMGIINASQGKMKKLPLIGGFTIIK